MFLRFPDNAKRGDLWQFVDSFVNNRAGAVFLCFPRQSSGGHTMQMSHFLLVLVPECRLTRTSDGDSKQTTYIGCWCNGRPPGWPGCLWPYAIVASFWLGARIYWTFSNVSNFFLTIALDLHLFNYQGWPSGLTPLAPIGCRRIASVCGTTKPFFHLLSHGSECYYVDI